MKGYPCNPHLHYFFSFFMILIEFNNNIYYNLVFPCQGIHSSNFFLTFFNIKQKDVIKKFQSFLLAFFVRQFWWFLGVMVLKISFYTNDVIYEGELYNSMKVDNAQQHPNTNIADHHHLAIIVFSYPNKTTFSLNRETKLPFQQKLYSMKLKTVKFYSRSKINIVQ